MPVSAKKLPNTKTQSTRRTAYKQRKQVARPGTRRNARGKASADITPIQQPGLHLLAKQLRPATLFECNIEAGNSPGEPGLFEMINTEARQLQCIEDLYAIVKAQPKYKKLKEPVWSESTKPVDVIMWLLRKLGPLANGEEWTIDNYVEGKKLRYMFVIYKGYSSTYVHRQEEYIPLDFLPFLQKRDAALHDLIIDIVALVSKRNNVPLWDADGDFSEALQWLGGHDEPDNTVFERQKAAYTKGVAAQYLDILRRRKRVIKDADIFEKVRAYSPSSERKRFVCGWINYGIKLAKKGEKITNHTYVPNYKPGNPVTPFRQYKFVWSLHQHDILRIRAFKRLRDDADKHGDYYPVTFSITKPGQKVKPLPPQRFGWGVSTEDHSFPIKLYAFMSDGHKNFCNRYRDYFYRNMLNEPQTPAERLLDAIDKLELKNIA